MKPWILFCLGLLQVLALICKVFFGNKQSIRDHKRDDNPLPTNILV
jgi:hypothetical protein